MSGRRIELSATQVVASMLAAVTGAIAASYTGIAGTVIGVAVMSIASTAGAAVYKHYLASSQEKLLASKERLRAAAVMMAPRSAHNGAAGHHDRPAASGPTREQGERAQGTGELASAAVPGFAVGQVGWLLSPDSPGTDEFPAVSGETTRWSNSPAEIAKPAEPGESAEPAGPAGSDGPAEPDGPAGPAGPVESAKTAKTVGSHQVWLRWPALLAAAFGVFVLALAAITVFEVAAGKPLEALIWGRSGGGTTVGVITGAQHTGPATRAKPHPARSGSTPTARPSPSLSPASSQSLSPSPSPTPTPTPTASSGSPSPSGAASQGQGQGQGQ
jgi:hypothetical protein